MVVAADTVRSPWTLLPPLASITVASAGSGLFQTLLPLRLRALGFTTNEVGFVLTCYSCGFIAGCFGAPVLIRSVGHVRASSAFAAVAALTVLAFEWHPDMALSMLVIFLTGIGGAGLAVVTESWLNELSAPEWRGRLLTGYVVLLAIAWACGQSLGLMLDIEGSRLVIVAAGFYVAALIPVAAIDVTAPRLPETARLDVLRAFQVAPVGAASCLFTGLVAATFMAIGPLYGDALGLDTRQTVLLMLASQAGVVLQWPLGLASDRFDRRYMLLGMGLVLAAIGAAMIAGGTAHSFVAIAVLFASFVGIAEAFYPIGVAHANDRADPAEYVMISSSLLLIWAIGKMIGPIAGTVALTRSGPNGLIWYAIVLSALFAAFAAWRIVTFARPVDEEREEFVAYPTSSPTILERIQFRKLRRRKETPP
ncbi:MAG TPA: MFS transporter [Stellaceae bacterium]|nr:MFS transporter [Stellaceae bacterium]